MSQSNLKHLIDGCNARLASLQVSQRAALQMLWGELRQRTDLPVIPEEWLEEGANGTGYFDNVCNMGSQIPLGVFFRGFDRHGRMAVICRSLAGNGDVMVMFERFPPGTPHTQLVICHQTRGGGADVDCNGHQAIRMFVTLAEQLAYSQWYTEKYLAEQAAA